VAEQKAGINLKIQNQPATIYRYNTFYRRPAGREIDQTVTRKALKK
jgi:hypothetical protein